MNQSRETDCRFASALSTAADASRAVAEACEAALEGLGGTPDLAMLFVSADRAEACGGIAAAVCRRLGCERLLGCTAESLVGVGRELEGETGLALWLARLPGCPLQTMRLTYEATAEGGSILGLADELVEGGVRDAAMLVFADPFSFPADILLARINADHPQLPVLGGMASGAARPGESRVILGSKAHAAGAVALLISGPVRVASLVSQGCRPVGTHFVITRAERNVIYELGGKLAVLQLHDVLQQLPAREQQMVRRGLHLGRVVSEYRDHFDTGDFLVRNVMGIDRESGAIVLGDYVRVGQTVKFHIRDAETADAELRQLLAAARESVPGCRGALMFTCNGRGTRLFPAPHHDADAVRAALGEIPLAGFFAAGEIGPVGGQNFVHGFTASMALFEPRE